MDVRVKSGMQSWIMGAATASLLSPGFLMAQTVPQATVPRSSAQPTRAKPAAATVRLAAHEPAEAVPQLAESEVEARLRELYERDGREMPNMAISPSPAAAPAQTPRLQAAPASQPRYSAAPSAGAPATRSAGAPAAAPAATAPKQENKVTGFFKKLVPGGNRKAAAQPPQQLQPAYTSPPVVQNLPPVAQPRNVAQPRPLPQVEGVSPPQPVVQSQPLQSAPAASQPAPRLNAAPQLPGQPTQMQFAPKQPARSAAVARSNPTPTARSSAAAAAVPQTPATRPMPRSGVSPVPAAPTFQQAEPQFDRPQLSRQDDEAEDAESMELDDLELDPTPTASSPTIAPPASGFDEEFPDPFAGASEEESSSEAIQNPYTGQTLEPLDTPPAQLAPVITPQPRVDRATTDETTSTKMRRIIQRTDMKGLKGFCPVTLRDQRELADSRPEHVASYRGQKFYCASKVAQAKFTADPARYAPAAYGADVVVLTDDQDVAEGSLDYAAWYKGRLYLFSNQETHDTFTANPERYASPPGIE